LWFLPKYYKQSQASSGVDLLESVAHVEEGSNTSTVALQVVRGDEKRTLFLGVINMGT
jgi:hypothetical protein